MRTKLAGAVAAGMVLVAGLVLAAEPVDWSKAFQRRSDDFDWSRVTNRTSAPPSGPVDWGKEFGKQGGAKPGPPAAAEPVAPPRAKTPQALPEETIEEPAPKPASKPAPAKPAPPAAPARKPAPALPAPTTAAPPALGPVPAIPPAPPAAQPAAPAASAAAAPEPAPAPAAPPVEALRPAVAEKPAAGPWQAPEYVKSPSPVLPAAPPSPAAAQSKPAAPSGESAAALQAAPSSPLPPAQPAPALPEPAAPPAKPAPAQVAVAEQPRPGLLLPKKGFSDDQVAHFLAAALPAPDAAAPGRPRLLTRWSGPVRLQVAGRGSTGAVAQVREAADEIAAALALEGRVSLAEAQPSNLQVFVLPSGPGEAPGYVQNAYDGAVITGSKVVLYANRASRVAVLRLLLEALGLPGRAPAGADSVLASAAPAESGLTALDRSALALLYSPVLAPGMDAASARQAAGSLR